MSPLPTRRSTAALGLASATVLLTGCFSGGSSGGPTGAADGDRLRLALAFPPVAALSPFSDDSVLISRMGVAETLVVFDESGAAQPNLAESWEFTDDRTVALELREGVTFHDGSPMDAEAVAGALTAAADIDPAPRSVSGIGLTARAVDEDTVELQAAEPDPLLVQRLGSSALVILSPAAYADPAAPDPVGTGTGPFEITEVNGESGATLDAFAEHWAGKPALSGVDVRFVSDAETRTNALRAEEVDVAQNIPIAQLSALDEDQVISVPLPRLTGLFLNTAEGPFVDAALRSAAIEAVDPRPVVEQIYEGQVDLAEGFLSEGVLGGDERPEVTRAPVGDPAGATIRLATWNDRPELPEAAAVVVDQLRSAGFTVELVVQEYATLEPDLLAGAFDAVLASRLYLGDTGDPVGYFESDLTCEGSYNLARLCDPAIDAAVAAAAQLVDPVERRVAAVEIEAQVLGTGAFVPLLHERSRIGVLPGVSGLGSDPFERQLVTIETAVQR
ncbi:ABC transporter substrate-binding protein [Blastococcus saxobsidens]|uniref:Peptide/nickel transport system substrate-binding protein n=1 Tax=Blastococcus saxobsidens TaxID=138336 RepID=A0A4Q7Y8T7_9ACTN|nr:ABC transporter substrate-binding protein [Blastococcus saxobsidens]RZU33517.1 peptide/nickel transport system substrate-binding protein [Blastococcus saxobsidens]